MLFSIIVPIYNVEKYVEKCINSVLAQCFDNYELILVNDGSLDNSLKICEKYTKDKHVVLVNKENGGLTSSRKAGIEKAKGDYILNIDGDDYVSDTFLTDLYSVISEKQYDCVCFDLERIYSNRIETNKKSFFRYGSYDRKQLEEEIFPYLITGINGERFPPSLCCKAIKKEILKPIQLDLPNSIIVGEDSCLSYSSIFSCNSLFYINKPLYKYVINEASITNTKKKNLKWNEPIERAIFMEKYLSNVINFEEQVARITSHSVANVVISKFSNYKYKEAKKDVKDNMAKYGYKKYVDKAKFKKNRRESITLFCLKHRIYMFFYLVSKIS